MAKGKRKPKGPQQKELDPIYTELEAKGEVFDFTKTRQAMDRTDEDMATVCWQLFLASITPDSNFKTLAHSLEDGTHPRYHTEPTLNKFKRIGKAFGYYGKMSIPEMKGVSTRWTTFAQVASFFLNNMAHFQPEWFPGLERVDVTDEKLARWWFDKALSCSPIELKELMQKTPNAEITEARNLTGAVIEMNRGVRVRLLRERGAWFSMNQLYEGMLAQLNGDTPEARAARDQFLHDVGEVENPIEAVASRMADERVDRDGLTRAEALEKLRANAALLKKTLKTQGLKPKNWEVDGTLEYMLRREKDLEGGEGLVVTVRDWLGEQGDQGKSLRDVLEGNRSQLEEHLTRLGISYSHEELLNTLRDLRQEMSAEDTNDESTGQGNDESAKQKEEPARKTREKPSKGRGR